MNINYQNQSGGRGFNAIIGIVVLVAFIFAFFYLAKSLFWLLTVLSPILLVLTLIINYKIVVNYIQFLGNQYKKGVLNGLLTTGLSIIFYPLVFGYLFFKALITRKVDKLLKEHEIRGKRRISRL